MVVVDERQQDTSGQKFVLFRVQKEKFKVKPFLKGLREFESRALKVSYAWKRVFEEVWRNFSKVKKVPPRTSDFYQIHNKLVFS